MVLQTGGGASDLKPMVLGSLSGVRNLKPPALLGSFDPLNLASQLNPAHLRELREAELKHSRLAMLAAAGWPLQELMHPALADLTRSKNLLAEGGMSPSILNGGLSQLEVAPALSAAVFLGTVLELNELRARRRFGLGVAAGMLMTLVTPDDAEFIAPEPRTPGYYESSEGLNRFNTWTAEERAQAVDAELTNGRLAMLAVTCYVLEEAAFAKPIVNLTPGLFEPIF